MTLRDTCQVATTRHDTFSWMFAFGRRIVGGSASEWRPWLALAWPLETGDVLSDTSALTRARMNWLGIQHVEARHNFVDFRWQSLWQCQVVQCFSVANIKSPSPVYGWWWGEEILRVQTIYTPAAQIGFSSQFKCVLLYTFLWGNYDPLNMYLEKRKRVFPVLWLRGTLFICECTQKKWVMVTLWPERRNILSRRN